MSTKDDSHREDTSPFSTLKVIEVKAVQNLGLSVVLSTIDGFWVSYIDCRWCQMTLRDYEGKDLVTVDLLQ